MKKLLHLMNFSGSWRKASYNTYLLHNPTDLLPQDVFLEILSLANLPFDRSDFDIPSSKERPENIVLFRDKLASTDALAIVSQECNSSTSGGLKMRSIGLHGEKIPHYWIAGGYKTEFDEKGKPSAGQTKNLIKTLENLKKRISGK